jgi:hypothetical protein
MAVNNPQAPTFFGDSSDFANKEEMVRSGVKFCVMSVTDTDTKYGAKWYLEISCGSEMKTMTFSHGNLETSKREQDFQTLSQHPEFMPIHSCILKKYSFEGKTGFRIAHIADSTCPCSSGERESEDDGEQLAPTPTVATTIAVAAPASQRKAMVSLFNRGKSAGVWPDMNEMFARLSAYVEQPVTLANVHEVDESLLQLFETDVMPHF